MGSSQNLGKRLAQYYNPGYMKYRVIRSRSWIYNAILLHGHSAFRLEILEYCSTDVLNEREQYFIDTIQPEYNILKVAGSLRGFKHSETTKERLRVLNMGRIFSEKIRDKIRLGLFKGIKIMVKILKTGETKSFLSIRQAVKFMGIYPGYVSGQLKENKFYLGKEFLVYSSANSEEDILNMVCEKQNQTKQTKPDSRSGRKSQFSQIILINNKNNERMECSSISSAAKVIGTGADYVRRCIRNNTPCKGYSVSATIPEKEQSKLPTRTHNDKLTVLINQNTQERREFPSIVSAAKGIGTSSSYMSRCIKNNNTCRGYIVFTLPKPADPAGP